MSTNHATFREILRRFGPMATNGRAESIIFSMFADRTAIQSHRQNGGTASINDGFRFLSRVLVPEK
jgi:hypothetical protein